MAAEKHTIISPLVVIADSLDPTFVKGIIDSAYGRELQNMH